MINKVQHLHHIAQNLTLEFKIIVYHRSLLFHPLHKIHYVQHLHNVPSNISVSGFGVHLDHSETCPFIAINTPVTDSVVRTPRAKPTLKSASVALKVSGRKAPVMTMVLSVTLLDRQAAVSIIESVPWVIRILVERASMHVLANFSLRIKKRNTGICIHVYFV